MASKSAWKKLFFILFLVLIVACGFGYLIKLKFGSLIDCKTEKKVLLAQGKYSVGLVHEFCGGIGFSSTIEITLSIDGSPGESFVSYNGADSIGDPRVTFSGENHLDVQIPTLHGRKISFDSKLSRVGDVSISYR